MIDVDTKLLNLFDIFITVPLLIAIGTDKLPTQFKRYLIIIAAIILILNLGKLWYNMNDKKVQVIPVTEGMINGIDCTRSDVHCIDLFDSSPGYSRPVLTINSGEIVVWKNIGEMDHSVTSTNLDGGMHPDYLFNSGYIRPGESFAVKFLKTGEYPYYCMVNKGWMRGKLIVN